MLVGSGTGWRWTSPLYVVAPPGEAVMAVVSVSEYGLAAGENGLPETLPLKAAAVNGPRLPIVYDVENGVLLFVPDAVYSTLAPGPLPANVPPAANE